MPYITIIEALLMGCFFAFFFLGVLAHVQNVYSSYLKDSGDQPTKRGLFLLSLRKPSKFVLVGIIGFVSVVCTYAVLYKLEIPKSVMRVHALLSFIMIWTAVDVLTLVRALMRGADQENRLSNIIKTLIELTIVFITLFLMVYVGSLFSA
ncbi:hypothetical protein ACFL1E_01965 [Candidatus Omnitrophota bacterium]